MIISVSPTLEYPNYLQKGSVYVLVPARYLQIPNHSCEHCCDLIVDLHLNHLSRYGVSSAVAGQSWFADTWAVKAKKALEDVNTIRNGTTHLRIVTIVDLINMSDDGLIL
jgi:hypothetical protein